MNRNQLRQRLSATRTAPNTLTVGTDCSSTTPCPLVVPGAGVVLIIVPAQIVTSGGLGVVSVYGDKNGVLWAATTSLALTCTNCSVVNGTQFPYNTAPLFVWSSSQAGVWDSVGLIDLRDIPMGSPTFLSGANTIVSVGPNGVAYSVDTTSIPVFVTPPATSTTPCSPQQFSYDGTYFYFCTAPKVWKRLVWSTVSW